ncbi:TonB-dependent receptor plug domain-containing protein [Polymorphobacter fuscus]|uniref:TonB-dependent receptor n=1 Tax=Sandarakinorhabdus fusca TaxID=1439888 RepID=A0A7C9GQ11_9SPHN|nr:TonB-dependent receptor [Polymorphobacter fuscus]KAB7647931.1 TonB-dependent receptor [Polymorphobacter fuscus]MQT17256.1 TonB-dependent receptor [Polymorphobacter fuscus]NJC08749.1 outer membrane receptor protein involved in Fe transport [Polymorphobacter fuscus]
MRGLRQVRHSLVCSTGLGLATAVLALAAPAGAQTAAPAAADPDPIAEQIIVTGTRVVRDGFQSPTPLTVLSQQEIQNQSPTNNLADFVNQVPALAGSTRPANSRLAISSGLAGINTLNLRNLGEVRTLVLLDGRRSVGSTITGLVDINTFPQSLVKSVEIVTGGASAAYGSDAVAGVVNFVLDKKYTGFKIDVDNGINSSGDGFNYSVSAAAGMPFADGRGHILLSGEYAHRDGIFSVDRDWNQIGYRTLVNPNYTATNGQPANLVVTGAGTWNTTPGSIIRSQVGGSTVLRGKYFDLGGAVKNYNFGTLTDASQTVGGDWQVNDTSRRIGLDATDDRRGAFGRVSYEVAPWLEVYGQASYNWNKTLFNAGPQAATFSLTRDNAYLVQALGAAALTGVTSVALGTSAADLPYRKNNSDRQVQRYTLGAGGEFQMFGNKSIWSAYAQYGQTDAHEQLRDIMNNNRMALATDAVFAPAGNALGVAAGTIVCRSTLTATTNGCLPLNRLGVGVANPAAVSWVLGDPYRDQRFKQTVAGVNLSMTPFATWAGDVSVAVGGEYRKEEVSGSVPTEFQTGWSVGNFLPTFGNYNVKEAYLETVIPLGLGAEFNGAVRATDYSTSGYVTTWKAGLTWQPIEDIRLRGVASRDIRAPNLNELFQSGTSRTNTFGTGSGLGQYAGRNFREVTTGNLSLRPEKSDSLTFGGVFQPRFVPGLSLSVDWYRFKVKDAISQLFADDIALRCNEGRQDFCNAITVDTSGVRDFVVAASPFNFAQITVRGMDYEASYAVPLARMFNDSPSSLVLRGTATNYLENTVNNGISIPVDTVGQNSGQTSGTPKWIFRMAATFDTPAYSITAVGRGVSSGTYNNTYIVCTTGCPASTPTNPTVNDNHIAGTFYTDLNFTAKIKVGSSDGQLFLNITNLFDKDPILLPETGLSANSSFSDLLGRAFRVGLRFRTN